MGVFPSKSDDYMQKQQGFLIRGQHSLETDRMCQAHGPARRASAGALCASRRRPAPGGGLLSRSSAECGPRMNTPLFIHMVTWGCPILVLVGIRPLLEPLSIHMEVTPTWTPPQQ